MKPYYKNELTTIYNGDCLEVMDYLIEQGVKVDAIITDPPYGNMKNAPSTWEKDKLKWDIIIEPNEIFSRAEKLLKKNAKLILFSQEPYTTKLIKNEISSVPFVYRMIWEKDTFANALGSKNNPVNMFEDIVVFKMMYQHNDTFKKYHYKIYKSLNMKKSEIAKMIGKVQCGNMFLEIEGEGVALQKINKEEYDIFMNLVEDRNEYFTYEEYNKKWNETFKSTFNLRPSEKYRSNIWKSKKDYLGLHPTQKPVELLSDLIYTYTNQNDLILDFTAGSFTTCVAAEQLNRRSIGIELEKKYCDIGVERLNNLQLKFDI
jgi:site-specific DNA-methyltransferase (adenine-specific)